MIRFFLQPRARQWIAIALLLPSFGVAEDVGLVCSEDDLLGRLQDQNNHLHCEAGSISCLRWSGKRMADQCVAENVPNCGRKRVENNRLLLRELRECDDARLAIITRLAATIERSLPSVDVVRQIPDITFADARRVAAEISDIEGHSWPIGCTPQMTPSVELEDKICLVRQAEQKLSLVSGLSVVLSSISD